MKYIRYYLPIFVLALVIVFFIKPKRFFKRTKAKIETHYYHATSEKPFVIIIPSYNNEDICERNLLSVFNQKYKNYRVIYIDDCSRDNTYAKVSKLINDLGQNHRVTLIKNEKNKGALENLYRAIHSCKEEEIVAIVDGDDFLSHDWVLEKLNCYYANPNIWLTYGSYLSYPQYTTGECSRRLPDAIFKKVSLRDYSKKHGMLTSHLRTFYAALFKKIKFQDFLYKGNFFDSTYDGAMMFPMIEMAGKEHIFFIKDKLYIYNRANPLNDDKVNFEKQQRCWRTILAMPPYQKLDSLNFNRDEQETYRADLMVFSYDRPLQLYAYLESLESYVKNYDKVTVLYRSSREEYQAGYDEVIGSFPEVDFCKQGADPKKDFQPILLKNVFREGSSEYIVFVVDDIIIKDDIDLNVAIQEMKKRDAYGFYFRLGTHVDYCYMNGIKQGIPLLIPFENQVYAWCFEEGRGDWKYPHSLDMTLYKKSVIEEAFTSMEYVNPNSLEAAWASCEPGNQIGLCYATSKIVNIPLGIVNPSTNRHMNLYSAEELLTLFNQGLKIDIEPLHHIHNVSAHIEYHPMFVERTKQ